MSNSDDLYDLLEDQRIATDSNEMAELQEHRATIETIIREVYPDVSMTIRYGGSKAKGTMILEAYDLDIIVYVHHGEIGLGDTLKDIYDNLAELLEGDYHVERKNSALRLSERASATELDYLHIDVRAGSVSWMTKKGRCLSASK